MAAAVADGPNQRLLLFRVHGGRLAFLFSTPLNTQLRVTISRDLYFASMHTASEAHRECPLLNGKNLKRKSISTSVVNGAVTDWLRLIWCSESMLGSRAINCKQQCSYSIRSISPY